MFAQLRIELSSSYLYIAQNWVESVKNDLISRITIALFFIYKKLIKYVFLRRLSFSTNAKFKY
eukprot:snap_masked-scaffold_6-processed-gene-13.46-mRNA-1 protein AED:1.00 eAED:1.00 QI:0/0/0/0/1/1/4/0/62